MKIGIAIYQDVQPMDFIGPWEVFSMWKNVLKAPIELHLISENGAEVACANQITVKATTGFAKAPQLDCLVIPGGQGRLTQANNEQYLTFLRQQGKKAEYILSICTGAFLLQKAGLLKNKSATTYWRALPELKTFSDIHIVEKRIVKDGNVWSSGGISSGIDLAIEFIAQISGKEEAGAVQLLFEYFPRDTLFTSEKTVSQLPPYYNSLGSPASLPQYIHDYIHAKTQNNKTCTNTDEAR
jgi:transcriptional regulator GlxA family with amidase domain